MKPRLLNNRRVYNPGDRVCIEREEPIVDLKFTVHKFTNRRLPDDKRKRLYIPVFSEFGSETITVMYGIPRLAQKFPGLYRIAMGWYGRSYLYKHLVDEYWEIDPDKMWLREYCRSFQHVSRNLSRLEEKYKGKEGLMADSRYMARLIGTTECEDCQKVWVDMTGSPVCRICKGDNLRRSLYGNLWHSKQDVCKVPMPSREKMELASKFLGENPVAVFARGRKCYGRNLEIEFYADLMRSLEERGYTPIWMGEAATCPKCPLDHVVDFCHSPEARDLETTLAIVKQCRFTVQFWTASTRLSAMMDTPYLLVESPSQLWDGSDYMSPGQEGYRLILSTFGRRKIVASNYSNFIEDQSSGLAAVIRGIEEMEYGNCRTILGPVEDESAAMTLWREFNTRTRLEF